MDKQKYCVLVQKYFPVLLSCELQLSLIRIRFKSIYFLPSVTIRVNDIEFEMFIGLILLDLDSNLFTFFDHKNRVLDDILNFSQVWFN